MEDQALKLVGAGIAMIGSLGAGIGLGLVFSAWLNALARNPSAEGKFRQVGFIGFAAAELVALLGFVIAMLILQK